jgi:NADH:ubiquinone oxidoreductase subunit
MANPFEIIGQLSTSKNDNWDELDEKDYNSFMVNRAFSLHHDTVMIANEMNRMTTIPKKWQYDFYRIAINPKKKRFAKWHKPEKDDMITLIMETYKVNRQRALSFHKLLDSDSLNTLKEMTTRGGK